jgi:Zn-dependent metalloprotease
MTKTLPIILLFSVLLLCCENLDIPKDYPTTYNKLSSSSISQMRASYEVKNPFMVTSLNEFGFCDYLEDLLNVGTPSIQASITKSEAIEKIKLFISQNSSETGVNNSDDISIYKISTDTGYGGHIYWHSKTLNQKYDTIEVMNTMILVHLIDGQPHLCVGNWYPNINVPKEFNFSQSKAKSLLKGQKVSHWSFGGDEYIVTISNEDLEKSEIRLKILPVETEDKIELRVCWEINIPGPVYYKIYVDVMTGGIIQQEPTIIS